MKYSSGAILGTFLAAGAMGANASWWCGAARAAGAAGHAGRVSSLSLVPDGLLAATAGAGVWKRDGVSGRWTRLTDSPRDLTIGAVAAAPSDPDVIYASAAANIYRSLDGGSTWTTVTPLPGVAAAGNQTSSIAVDPTDPEIVWVGGTLGVFRSDTAGATWATIASIRPNAIRTVVDLELDPSDTNVAYYSDSRHVWKYDAAAGSLPLDVSPRAQSDFVTRHPGTTYVIALAIAPSNHEILYAAYAFSGNVNTNCSAGLYRTTDGGAHWQSIPIAAADDYFSDASSSGTGTQCDGVDDNAIAVDPLDSNHVVAGGVALAEFTFDSSSSVLHVQRDLSAVSHAPPNHHALAFDAAGDLYDGNDGGVWYFPHRALTPGGTDPGVNLSR